MDKAVFIAALDEFQAEVHQTAIDKGWWENPREFGTQIALMHSELSEALECCRVDPNQPDKHLPQHKAIAVEFADVIIRICDTCEKYGFDLAQALVDKAEFNKGRSTRHGGKNF